jgi:hypothetical protein
MYIVENDGIESKIKKAQEEIVAFRKELKELGPIPNREIDIFKYTVDFVNKVSDFYLKMTKSEIRNMGFGGKQKIPEGYAADVNEINNFISLTGDVASGLDRGRQAMRVNFTQQATLDNVRIGYDHSTENSFAHWTKNDGGTYKKYAKENQLSKEEMLYDKKMSIRKIIIDNKLERYLENSQKDFERASRGIVDKMQSL